MQRTFDSAPRSFSISEVVQCISDFLQPCISKMAGLKSEKDGIQYIKGTFGGVQIDWGGKYFVDN